MGSLTHRPEQHNKHDRYGNNINDDLEYGMSSGTTEKDYKKGTAAFAA